MKEIISKLEGHLCYLRGLNYDEKWARKDPEEVNALSIMIHNGYINTDKDTKEIELDFIIRTKYLELGELYYKECTS